MEACRRLPQTARVATLWSGQKFRSTHPMLIASKRKEQLGGAILSSPVTSQTQKLPYRLTEEEAFMFLDCKLGISHSQVYAGGRSLDFLNHVITRMNETLPFTNINLFSEKFSEFTPEDWKHPILSGQGGTCLWINPFTKALLKQLGHTVYHILGDISMGGRNETLHISTIACDVLYPGSRHLVDPGTRWYLGKAVPLDFEKESPEYSFYNIKTKLFKKDNDTVTLCTPTSSTGPDTQVVQDSLGKNWRIRIVYWLNQKSEWYEFNGKVQELAKTGKHILEPFDKLLFFGILNKTRVTITCSDGQAHVTFQRLTDDKTDSVVMTKRELMQFFAENYPQYSVNQLEKVFEASRLI